MAHSNARLNVRGRLLLVERIEGGMPVADAAQMGGISRRCGYKWWGRWREEGLAGLLDRSSRPHTSPGRTSPEMERMVIEARLRLRVGPERLAYETGVPARTVARILRRWGMPYLRDCDPITGEVVRASKSGGTRYERSWPGSLAHMDVKKLGRIPDGGGWRIHGRADAPRRQQVGWTYIHSVVDDYTRLAYSESLPDEKAETVVGFFTRAAESFQQYGVTIEEVMTDNHLSYTRSRDFAALLRQHGIKHITIKPHCPWQNGKAERYNRTLKQEWAYQQAYYDNQTRDQALTDWVHYYNNHRPHTSLGGQPPTTRL